MRLFSYNTFNSARNKLKAKGPYKYYAFLSEAALELFKRTKGTPEEVAEILIDTHVSAVSLACSGLTEEKAEQLRTSVLDAMPTKLPEKPVDLEEAQALCERMWNKVESLRYSYFGKGAEDLNCVKPDVPKTLRDCWIQLNDMALEQKKLREDLAATGTDAQYGELIREFAQEQSL